MDTEATTVEEARASLMQALTGIDSGRSDIHPVSYTHLLVTGAERFQIGNAVLQLEIGVGLAAEV